MAKPIALLITVLVLVGAACDTGQVDRGRFDAIVEERDAATRRLVESATQNDELREQVDQLTEALDATIAASPPVDVQYWADLLAEFDAAWTDRDVERLMLLYDDDTSVELAAEGLITRGAPAVREFHQEFLDRYQSLNIESEIFEARQDHVVFLWEGSGIRLDGSFELLAGGTLLELVDGLIVRQVDYTIVN